MKLGNIRFSIRWDSPLLISIILALGFIFRVIPSFTSLYVIRADEIDYWEQSHKLVYGFGCIGYDYMDGVGARSLLYAWPVAFPLYFAKILGLNSPVYYIPFVKIFLSLISLVIPIGMWHVTRIIYDNKAALLALILGCFWYELVLSANHGLTEFYTVYFSFAALLFIQEKIDPKRSLLIGILLGLAFLFRPHNLVPITLICVWAGTRMDRKSIIFLGVGGILSITSGFLYDFYTWGEFAHSYKIYLTLYGKAAEELQNLYGVNPKWLQLANLTICSGGILTAVLFFAAISFKENKVISIICVSTFVFYSTIKTQEHSFVFIVLPFLLCILSRIIICDLKSIYKTVAIIYIIFVCLNGLTGKLVPITILKDNWTVQVRQAGLFYKDPWLSTGLALSRMEPGSVLWSNGDAATPGGYFVFHHHQQIFFPGGVRAHAELIKDLDIHKFIKYLVIPSQPNVALKGFHLVNNQGVFSIFENDSLPKNQEVNGYAFNLQLPLDQPSIDLLLKSGVIKSKPKLTYWN